MDSRTSVELPSIDPKVPGACVACLTQKPSRQRRLVFRRSDKTVERVCAVHWPYCEPCHAKLAGLDREQRFMTWSGAAQVLVVVYLVGAAIGMYEPWWPSLGLLAASFAAFWVFAKRAKALWGLEWARIDEVYKGGRGACFSFRNAEYAERFAQANGVQL